MMVVLTVPAAVACAFHPSTALRLSPGVFPEELLGAQPPRDWHGGAPVAAGVVIHGRVSLWKRDIVGFSRFWNDCPGMSIGFGLTIRGEAGSRCTGEPIKYRIGPFDMRKRAHGRSEQW